MARPRIDRSSAKQRPTPTTVDEFSLSGPSRLPNPDFNAYRRDLADVALATRVIASHYAEPLERVINMTSSLRGEPSDEAPILRELHAGEIFAVLDDSLGWAWGYAGSEWRVGYVDSQALAAR